jgi:ribonucleoside-diphosphate reductase alpha chain
MSMADVRSSGVSKAPALGHKRFHGRLKIDAKFCPEDVDDLFTTVDWEVRSAQIKGENGELIFEQTNCEVPSFWSQLATNVICSKYFYGEVGTPEREYSVKQLVHRVARTITDWGLEDGYFTTTDDGERFYRELAWLCLHQHGAFNSPVWFNVGLYHQYGVSGAKCNWRWDPQIRDVVQPENPYEYPQGSACFIQHVADNMEDIMELARSEAMLFKFGSGTGTDLSTLRSHREKLAGGGKPSGPLSFMRVYDQVAAVVKSGGKTRRAAKMQSIKVWHPDVMEFIECKWKEEQKAHTLIASGKYEANFNGEAYSSIMFQNANLSVRVTDDFMQAVEKNEDWTTHWVTDPKQPGPTYPAREIMDRMADCAWHCGDPGVQYDTTINRWHTCPNSGRINASNPCVTGDTLVATAEGYRRIDSLVGETVEVINGQGRKSIVDRIFPTGRKPVFELRTHAGYRVRLTADHRVWTENRGDVPAAELMVDDIVRLERPGFGNDFVPAIFGELVGAVVGDGQFIRRQDAMEGMTISRNHQEPQVAARLQKGIEQCQRWLHEETEPDIWEKKLGPATLRTVGASTAVPIKICEFADMRVAPKIRKFTDRVFNLDKPSQAAILRGLFTLHGGAFNFGEEKSQYVSLECPSLQLLEQVQLLLLGFGIRSRICVRRRALGQVITITAQEPGLSGQSLVDEAHSLRISRASRLRFEEEVGFLAESIKAEQLAKLNLEASPAADSLIDAVASLKPCGEEDVYDLTEPVTNHFVANGIVVHNCSEYMFLDDTACNLASINLMKFRGANGLFDTERFKAACRIFFIAQEILVDHASYPTRDIARNSHLFRPLGLGYSNLGSLLMAGGVPYDSDEARGICGAVTALLHGAANLTSSELAEAVGPFETYEINREPFLRVMQMHRDAVDEINAECPEYLQQAAARVWDEVLAAGAVHGFRNAQATVLAPTGTISFMMDCDTTGIEPDIALVKYKQLAGGGMLKIVNQTVPLALQTLGYDQPQIGSILAYIDEHDTIEGSPDLKEEHLAVFDCAFTPRKGKRSIAWQAHVLMMAAAQPFLSGAISKTVNMPRDSTPEDIAKAYFDGWKLGLKALAIYRDGSKESQPLSTSTEGQKAAAAVAAKPRRERLEDTRHSITHKFSVSGHEGYITVGLFPDGRPGELFITMAKEGSTIGGLMDAFGTAVSMSLQYGVPLEDYVRKFSHMRFEPQGYTKNPDIKIAKSLIDYIFRWLGMTFLPGYKEASLGVLASEGDAVARLEGESTSEGDGDPQSRPVAAGPRKTAAGKKVQGSGVKGQGDGKSTPDSRQPIAKAAPNPQSPAPVTNGRTNGHANGHTNGHSHGHGTTVTTTGNYSVALLARAGVMVKGADGPITARSELFAEFQSDAPACDNCGAITVRAGNCYLCHNCGSSMGCS